MLLLPGEAPVRIKLPETSQYIEVFSLRVLPEGTEIDPSSSATYTIICPDLSVHKMSSDKGLVCPERSIEVDLLVEVLPDWGVGVPDPTKGDEPLPGDILDDKLQHLHEAEDQITQLPIEQQVKIFLLVNLYVNQHLYTQAIERFEDELLTQNDSFALRLLGYVYLQAGESRKAGIAYYKALEFSQQMGDIEGQALAHHQLALLYQLFENPDEATQHAQAALDAYQRLGNTAQCEDLQKILQELQK